MSKNKEQIAGALCFHAQVCLSEAFYDLNEDCYAPEYKVKLIKEERTDYIEAFYDKEDADENVIRQFDDMLNQLPTCI